VDDNITGKRREVMRWQIERNEGWRGGEDVLLTTALLSSSQSSSLLLSLIPIHPPHYLSPSFLSVIMREVMMKWMERNEGGEVVRRRIERKEGERQ
jgi:hypothetical protein